MSEQEEIVLRIADPSPCGRCDGATLLQASFPTSWKNARSEDVRGIREVALCAGCDRGGQAADELLALFAVDGQIGLSTAETFNDLVVAWVESEQQRKLDTARLDAEHELWWRGEL